MTRSRAATGHRHVEHVMGTVFSVEVVDDDEAAVRAAVQDVVALLHRVDAVFSTYREDSDICALRRGERSVPDCAPEVAEVLDLCVQATRDTDGYFSALYDGRLDPTGLVKGWSIEQASALLHRAGLGAHSINGGGDVRTRGAGPTAEPWRIGVSTGPGECIATVSGHDLAVATSGTTERGLHIVDPRSGRAAGTVRSATVVGPDLSRADAYATALVAAGAPGLAWLGRLDGYAGLVLTADGELIRSPEFPLMESTRDPRVPAARRRE